MLWADAVSTRPDLGEAADEASRAVLRALGRKPDLVCAFVSPHHARRFARAPALLSDALEPRLLAGCSGGGVIGAGRELEDQPCLGLVAAVLPDVELRGVHVEEAGLPDPDGSPKAWARAFGKEGSRFLVLADPYSFDPEDLLRGLDYAFPGAGKIGGLASGATRPGANALFLGRKAFSSGAVVVSLSGNIELDPIVAQGCRPIGPPFRVTRCYRNLLLELDGARPLERLEELLESLTPDDQELARGALFVGLLTDAVRGGDYLIRNLLNVDTDQGFLAVGAPLRNGQTVRFHVRDRAASAKDLARRLEAYACRGAPTTPRGALLFSCMGRGKRLYRRANHDSELLFKKLGRLPMAGFFGNGEIGPVDGSTYLHGYTSAFGIFRPAR